MTNIITNACAAVASVLINIHSSTNLQSLVRQDLEVFWTIPIQHVDTSFHNKYLSTLFIDPWVFDMPDINLNRIPRAHLNDNNINDSNDIHPSKYYWQ